MEYGFSDHLRATIKNYLIQTLQPALEGITVINDLRINADEEHLRLSGYENKQQVFEFALTQLPGCCGVIVSHNAFVGEAFREQSLGENLLSMREQIAKTERFGLMIATVLETNDVQKHLLTHHMWKKVCSFTNPKTGHPLGLWIKVL